MLTGEARRSQHRPDALRHDVNESNNPRDRDDSREDQKETPDHLLLALRLTLSISALSTALNAATAAFLTSSTLWPAAS